MNQRIGLIGAAAALLAGSMIASVGDPARAPRRERENPGTFTVSRRVLPKQKSDSLSRMLKKGKGR